MARHHESKRNSKSATIVLSLLMFAMTAALCVVAFLGVNGELPPFPLADLAVTAPQNEDAQRAAPPQESAPAADEPASDPADANEPPTGDSDVSAVLPAAAAASDASEGDEPAPAAPPAEKAQMPSELRCVQIHAGQDFPADGGEEETRAAIDRALNAVGQMGVMNAVAIDPMTADGKVVYSSELLESTGGFDALAYAIEQARARNLYVLVSYYLTDTIGENGPSEQGAVDADVIDAVRSDAERFAAQYQPDAVLVDGYYNVSGDDAYARYLKLGGAIGFEEYEDSISEALLRTAREAFEKTDPSIRFGLLTEAAWANDYEDERGSATKAPFSALIEGNTDTLALLDEGLADLIAVKAFGSTGDGSIPFYTVADWWNRVSADYGVPLYIVHAASRAVTSAAGWSEYDQLARQVIDARTLGAYKGSIFDSLTRMLQNEEDFAQKLIGYYEGTVREEHILQNLELTRPAKTVFTTYDPIVSFAGNTDPNTEATINGQLIPVDANGYFQIDMDLEEGDNVFKIEHKGKSITYTITRVTEVVKEVSPASGTVSVDGGTKITITAIAYQQASVTASVAGRSITLTQAESEDDELRETNYARFTGTFTAPDATTSVQNLGAITVTGTWNGITKSKTGASIRVNEKVLPSDGLPVRVTAALAETFPASTMSQYSDPTYLPLPRGALDYALGDPVALNVTESGKNRTYTFYRLQSGLRVLAEDITAVSVNDAPVNNTITGCTVSADYRKTRVILATKQKVAYTARYSSSAVTVQFHYTNSLPDSMSLDQNPLFSAVTFKGDTMTLTLRRQGIFAGYNAYYDTDGNLVLEFRNPANSISGAKIVIDPGHGSGDTGALGYLANYPEAVINYGIASRLADILRNTYGANVYLIPSNMQSFSLAQRVATAEAQDPDLFIAVHNNSSATSASATGTEAYYFNAWSSAMTTYSAQNIAGALGTTNRGGKFSYYYVTRTMRYPAVLLECGFVSNQGEYAKLVNAEYQNQIASAIARAASSYFQTMAAGTATGTQSVGSSQPASEPVSEAPAGEEPASGEEPVVEEPASEEPASEESSSEEPEVVEEPSSTEEEEEEPPISINYTGLEMLIGESEELLIDWASDGDIEIEWGLPSTGDSCITLEANNDVATVTAVAVGETVVRARIKGDDSTYVECRIRVSE